MTYYAGIGSRETPPEILKRMVEIGDFLGQRRFILRSGGAIGADRAFEAKAIRKEIFYADDATEEAIELTAKFHPNWKACKPHARKLHGRNAMIILGRDLKTPVQFVISWTKDGMASGGTGQALRIAKEYGIPEFNLFHGDVDLKDGLSDSEAV